MAPCAFCLRSALLTSCTASVACIAPIIRFQTLNFLRQSGNTDVTCEAPLRIGQTRQSPADPTSADTSASSLYWMNIEYNLGLVAGSIACLRPLFIKFGWSNPKALSSSGDLQNKMGGYLSTYKLRTIGGGPRSRRSAKRGASNRVQGESILDTVMTVEVGGEEDRQTDADCKSRQGSTDRIVQTKREDHLESGHVDPQDSRQ